MTSRWSERDVLRGDPGNLRSLWGQEAAKPQDFSATVDGRQPTTEKSEDGAGLGVMKGLDPEP